MLDTGKLSVLLFHRGQAKAFAVLRFPEWPEALRFCRDVNKHNWRLRIAGPFPPEPHGDA